MCMSGLSLRVFFPPVKSLRYLWVRTKKYERNCYQKKILKIHLRKFFSLKLVGFISEQTLKSHIFQCFEAHITWDLKVVYRIIQIRTTKPLLQNHKARCSQYVQAGTAKICRSFDLLQFFKMFMGKKKFRLANPNILFNQWLLTVYYKTTCQFRKKK